MDTKYDMCVDYDSLCNLEQMLNRISQNMGDSADTMLYALKNSSGFLSGAQFDRACQTTVKCSDTARYTMENITEVLKYITRLKRCLEEYSGCGYSK